MNKNIKKIVYNILDTDKYAREDTMYLIQKTILQMLNCNQGTAFGQVIQGMKYKGISFESITRAKRKYLEEHPTAISKETQQTRRQEEENYFMEYSN